MWQQADNFILFALLSCLKISFLLIVNRLSVYSIELQVSSEKDDGFDEKSIK